MRVDAGRLRMTVERTGEDVRLVLAGVLDVAGRRAFREQVRELLGRGGGVVAVDVGGLDAVDVAALAALLRADLLLRAVHSELRIVSPTPAFVELLTATGLVDRLGGRGAAPRSAGGRSLPAAVGAAGRLRAGRPEA
nr:STAS domain-containing protein [Micromonospora sp. DSM 115978]